jgi:hypothetical protein
MIDQKKSVNFKKKGIWWVGHHPSVQDVLVNIEGEVFIWNESLSQYTSNHSAGKSLIGRCRKQARDITGNTSAYGPRRGRRRVEK